ncbi:hypothetical protein EON65_49895 [archaeon]|nr:MAG: hypothetical protein EON65_49895 [archaeon]
MREAKFHLLPKQKQKEMTSKGKEPPQFITFGAQVFTSILVSSGLEGSVTPEVLRRWKMSQQTIEDEVTVFQYVNIAYMLVDIKPTLYFL